MSAKHHTPVLGEACLPNATCTAGRRPCPPALLGMIVLLLHATCAVCPAQLGPAPHCAAGAACLAMGALQPGINEGLEESAACERTRSAGAPPHVRGGADRPSCVPSTAAPDPPGRPGRAGPRGRPLALRQKPTRSRRHRRRGGRRPHRRGQGAAAAAAAAAAARLQAHLRGWGRQGVNG